MKRFAFILFVILLTSCTARYTPAPVMAAPQDTARPTITPTYTPVPSATIGYQDTAIVAQQTAMEAVRVNAQITAEFEQRVQAQLQMTAESDRRYQEILGWTQTAMSTSVPLTATQQMVVNTHVAGQQTLEAAHMTGTAQMPTMIVAIAQAENYAGTVALSSIGEFIFKAVVPLLLLVIVIIVLVLLLKPEKQKVIVEPEAEASETVIWVGDKNNSSTTTRYAFPCTAEQLTELASLIVNGERTLGINRLENGSETLRRPVLYAVRDFLVANGWALEPKPGEIAINETGVDILTGWFDDHQLPEGFAFSGEMA